MTALHAPQLARLRVYTEDSTNLDQVAPYLCRLTQLRTLVLDGIVIDRITVLHYWPKPLFKLETLVLDFDPTSFGLSEFSWLADSSRDSLRHLTLTTTNSELVSNLSRWGSSLRTLDIKQYSFRDTISREERFSQAVDVIRLGRRAGLDKLDFLIVLWEYSGSDDACAVFEDEVEAVAEEVNNQRGREVVRVRVDG